jgi:acyl-CoA reductase-like NAD-dependent aldehyde dehydrogenase
VQQEKILSYIKLGRAELLTGGEQNHLEGDLAGGYYIKPTLLKGIIKCAFSRRDFRTRFSGYHFQNN